MKRFRQEGGQEYISEIVKAGHIFDAEDIFWEKGDC